MKRIKLEVAYDGTNYYGWQLQPGKVTIEGMVNKALSELLREDIKVIGQAVQILVYMLKEMLPYLIPILGYLLKRFAML